MKHHTGMPRGPRTMSGVTLIELMIVVVVVSILAAIAYPSYSEYVIRAGRTDGRTLLLDTAQALERCMSMYGAYNDANCGVAFPRFSDENYYTITAGNAAVGATTFTLTATPVAGDRQSSDSDCTSLSLNQAGVRTATGADTSVCW